MKHFLLSAFTAIGILSGNSGHAVEIQNFVSGLNCWYSDEQRSKKSEYGWICFPSETVNITGQGRCVYDGTERPCTWYGFEFDYSSSLEDTKVSCSTTIDQPGNFGNPKQIEKAETETFEYTFILAGHNGHFYNPQYSLFSTASQKHSSIKEETVCSADGKELFRYNFIFNYPQLRLK